MGERAATWDKLSREQAIDNLEVLWRYSLLRCRLASRADTYPDEAFETMLLLGESVKALGIAELLTDSGRKVHVLLLMARLLVQQNDHRQEATQLVKQAMVVASLMENPSAKDAALSDVARDLVLRQQWQEAERVIGTIADLDTQAEALGDLTSRLAQAHQWETLLIITQESWKSAQTEQEVLALFSLAFHLFPISPLLGRRLHEAFEWVNTFLRT